MKASKKKKKASFSMMMMSKAWLVLVDMVPGIGSFDNAF
jgi:hypothetical protein